MSKYDNIEIILSKPGSELTDEEKKLRKAWWSKEWRLKNKDNKEFKEKEKIRQQKYRESLKPELAVIKLNKKEKIQNIINDNNELKEFDYKNFKSNIELSKDVVYDINPESLNLIFYNIEKLQNALNKPAIPSNVKHWMSLVLKTDGNISNTELKKLSRFLYYMNNNNIDNFIEQLIKIRTIRRTTVKTYFSKSWLKVLNRLRLFNKDFELSYKKLVGFNNYINYNYEENRGENNVKEDDKHKIFDYDPKKTLKVLNEISDLQDKLIFALYTQNIAPRRLDNSSLILTDKDINDLKDQNNYVQLVDNIPTKLIYNNYKTFKTYGTQIFDIEPVVKKILIEYIQKNNLNTTDNNKLFPNFSNFSLKLSEVFNNSYNTNGITLRWIRISAATFYSKKYQKNFNKRKQIAYYMAHSFVENNLYTKYDSDDSEY